MLFNEYTNAEIIGKFGAQLSINSLKDELDKILPHVVICKAQCKLISRRLNVICNVLNRLPDPTPTPALLSILECGVFLVSKMCELDQSYTIVIHHFICSSWFIAFRKKLKSIWKLQKTSEWELEDKVAQEEDEISVLQFLNDGIKSGLCKVQWNYPEDKMLDCLRVTFSPFSWKISYDKLYFSTKNLFNPDLEIQKLFQKIYLTNETIFPELVKLSSVFLNSSYEGKPCVIKTLVSPNYLKRTSLSIDILEAYIIDMRIRQGWCHPHLIEYIGGFGERPSEENKECMEFCLGVVMNELPTKLTVLECDSTSENSSYPCYWKSSNQLFTTLHQLLFIEGAKLTLKEALEIGLQVGCTLQYMLLDEEYITPSVKQAWLSLTPTNIFVREAQFIREKATSVGIDVQGAKYDTRFSPRFYFGNDIMTRWEIPKGVAFPESYAIAQFIICIFMSRQPFEKITKASEGISIFSINGRNVKGITVPDIFPQRLQILLTRSLLFSNETVPLTKRSLSSSCSDLCKIPISLSDLLSELRFLLQEPEIFDFPLDEKTQRSLITEYFVKNE